MEKQTGNFKTELRLYDFSQNNNWNDFFPNQNLNIK